MSADFATRVRNSFDRQQAMKTLGMRLERIEAGHVEMEMIHSDQLTQQHGFIHAGIVTSGMDTACGYAAFSLMPDTAEVLTVEFKANLLRPAAGEHFRFIGKVIKPGRTLMFCEGETMAIKAGSEVKIATLSATMMAVTKPL